MCIHNVCEWDYRQDSMIKDAQTSNSHIIALVETKLYSNPPAVQGYAWVLRNWADKKRGGWPY